MTTVEHRKARRAWLDAALIQWISEPACVLFARAAWITPNRVTFVGAVVRVGAILEFAAHRPVWAVIAYWVSVILDGIDGGLARLTGRSSEMGRLFDYSCDFGAFPVLCVFVASCFSIPVGYGATCAGLGVASALVTANASHGGTSGAVGRSRSATKLMDLTARLRLEPIPGVIDAHLALFIIAPLIGRTAVLVMLILCSAYFFATWVLKLRILGANDGR